MKCQQLICRAFLVLALAGFAQAELIPIPVPDSGFDEQVLSDGGYAYIGDGPYAGDLDYPGPWQAAGGTAWIDNGYYPDDPSRRGQKLYAWDMYADEPEDKSVYQILDETFSEGITYVLSVWVALADRDSGHDAGWTLSFTGEDYGDVLVETSGQAQVNSWEQVSLEYTATTADAEKKIGIKLKGNAHVCIFDNVTLSYVASVTIPVDSSSDLAAANAEARAGDTILFAKGVYLITSPIKVKDGVTYQGAGTGQTRISGQKLTRAFTAWGDRTYNDTSENVNDSGPKGWILDGFTFQNCVADGNDMFSYAAAAFDLMDGVVRNDTDASGGLDIEEADGDVDAIRLPGPDGIEQSLDDDNHRFDAMDTDGNGQISEAELSVQILSEEVEFGDENRDGGAVCVDNGAVGTIQNCEFLNNNTPIDGDDGGALNIAGLSVVTVNDCRFEGNYAVSQDSPTRGDGDGGHIKVQGNAASVLTPGTTLIANRCKFYDGVAEDDGGAIHIDGVGCIVRLDACWFSSNFAMNNGTVLSVEHEGLGELTVTNCGFSNNVSTLDSNRMIQTRRNSKFINCTFVNNNQGDQALIHNNADAADTSGNGAYDEFSDTTEVVNCLFFNNVVGNGDRILESRSTAFTIAASNCLFFGNIRQNGSKAPNMLTDQIEAGSVEADPLLDNTFYPGAGSPAIDAGIDPAAFGVELLTDFSGNVRPQGAGYDIGADEQ